MTIENIRMRTRIRWNLLCVGSKTYQNPHSISEYNDGRWAIKHTQRDGLRCSSEAFWMISYRCSSSSIFSYLTYPISISTPSYLYPYPYPIRIPVSIHRSLSPSQTKLTDIPRSDTLQPCHSASNNILVIIW